MNIKKRWFWKTSVLISALSPLTIIAACATTSTQQFGSAKALAQVLNEKVKTLKLVKDLSYDFQQIETLVKQDEGQALIREIKDLNQVLNQEFISVTIASDQGRQPLINQSWISFKLKLKTNHDLNDLAYTKWFDVQFAPGGLPPEHPDQPAIPPGNKPEPPETQPPNTPIPPSNPIPPVSPIPPAPTKPLPTDVISVKQEAKRINESIDQLFLKKPNGIFSQNQKWDPSELEAISPEQVLDYYLGGFTKQPGFTYRVVNWTSDAWQTQAVAFNIIVSKNNANAYTERLVINNLDVDQSLIDKESLVDQEIERINGLKLKPIIYENQQVMEDVFFQSNGQRILKRAGAQLGLNREKFDYEALDVQTDRINWTTSFTIKVKSGAQIRISQPLKIQWSHWNQPSFADATWKAEKQRLANLTLSLKQTNLTSLELNELNAKNLWSKLNGFEKSERFSYKIDNLMKDERNGIISFQIWFVHRDLDYLEFRYDETQQPFVNFKVQFNQVPIVNADQWSIKDDQYIKNSNRKVNPINDGSHYLAAKGTGGNDINVSQGQGPTNPSDGVEQNAILQTGKIKTEVELKQLKNTFSIGFESFGGGWAFGSAWIIDYQLKPDGSDPDTFYLATNAHVAQNLKIANDLMTPERYEAEVDPFYNTKNVTLATIKDPQIGKTYDHSANNEQYLKATLQANQVRTVFIGNDYLTTSPNDFNQTNGSWANNEEYLDFAVLEIKFDSAKQASAMSQNYAKDPSRQFKYQQQSLLAQEQPVIKNNYSVLGFPATRKDSYWRPTILTTSRSINDSTNNLATLASSPYYNSFYGKTGVFDAAIGLSFFGYNYREAYQVNNWYVSSGLIYPLDYGSLGEGSSGSMMVDKDGWTMGIHFAGDFKASTGFTTALYSEGFDYQGAFGKYNLQGYDAIDGNRVGNHPNQKHSYRTNMLKIYGNNVKTNLYPNGFSGALKMFS